MHKICEGNNVYLRAIELKDTELIVKWKSDRVVRKMSVGLNTEISYENQYEDIQICIDEGEEIYSIIILKGSEEAIGYIRISWLDNDMKMAWLRFGLGTHRGEGHAKDSLKCMIKYLFNHDVHRIDAEVLKYNEPSQGVLKSVGFDTEGIRSEAYYDGVNYVDVLVFGIVNRDLLI